MKIIGLGEDGKEWELAAPIADGYKSEQRLHARDIKIILYEKGKKSTNLTADEGVIRYFTGPATVNVSTSSQVNKGPGNLGPGDLYLSGHVVAISTDGTKLLTDWLHYNKFTGLITSTAPVRIIRDDSMSQGVGLEATSNFSSVKIFNQKVTIKVKPVKKS